MSGLAFVKSRPSIKSGDMSSNSVVIEDQQDESSKNPKNPPSGRATIWEYVMSIGNVYLHILPERKIFYYILTLLIFSMMKESDFPHLEFLTGKHSTLNQVFVKLGWAWTFGVFAAYRLASLSIRSKPLPALGQLCIRLVVTSFFFYAWCAIIFPTIEGITGACIHNRIKVEMPKKACLKRKGYEYDSFDISGHSYLLTYCVLIIMEESKESLYFLQLARLLRKADGRVMESNGPLLDRSEAKNLERRFNLAAPIISFSYLCMCALSFLWDFMIIITTIYYHTFSEKILGTSLAICMWYLLYRRLLPL